MIFSPARVFGQHNAAPWAVLVLCLIWLGLKRKEVWQKMNQRVSLTVTIPGLALVVGAILMPSSWGFLIFRVLLASLGVFVIFFGWGAKIPAIVVGIYGFATSFPLVIHRFAELPYSMSTIKPLVWVLTNIGFVIENQRQWLHLITSSGESISVMVTAACAGPATIGVFLAIFALMMLDIPLQPKKAGYMFLLGIGGTWLLSIIRLIILMLAGYYMGEQALWTTHSWSIYILFPLWYLLFAYVYFRQVIPGQQMKARR
jgi:exosortase/archaeosortase family protein